MWEFSLILVFFFFSFRINQSKSIFQIMSCFLLRWVSFFFLFSSRCCTVRSEHLVSFLQYVNASDIHVFP